MPDTLRGKYAFKPVLDLQILASDGSEPKKLNFTWDLMSYTSRYVDIQLYFEIPPYVSSNIEYDELYVTFWGGNEFKDQ